MRKFVAVLLLAMPLFADVILEPPRDKVVKKVRMTVTTGADDFRRGSKLAAFVVLRDGRRIESETLKCDGLAAHSKKALVWRPSEYNPFAIDEIQRFGLTFHGTNDQWDLDALEVEATDGERTKTVLRAKPVKHFRNGETWESGTVAPR
jgi:hypothetical protein